MASRGRSLSFEEKMAISQKKHAEELQKIAEEKQAKARTHELFEARKSLIAVGYQINLSDEYVNLIKTTFDAEMQKPANKESRPYLNIADFTEFIPSQKIGILFGERSGQSRCHTQDSMNRWADKSGSKKITIDGFWVHYVAKKDESYKPLILVANAHDSTRSFYIFFSMMMDNHATTVHKNNIVAGQYGKMIKCPCIVIHATQYKHR